MQIMSLVKMPCSFHRSNDYRAGELVRFEDMTEGAQGWLWDFGDGQGTSVKRNPYYSYQKEGEYHVRLLVNDACEKTEVIIIKPKLVVLDPSKFPVFDLPKSIVVGETLEVIDLTEHAKEWEWRFGDTARVNATTQTATYVYENPGLRTVTLIVNGDLKYKTRKKIRVLPKPEIVVPERKVSYQQRDKRHELDKAPKKIEGEILPQRPPTRPKMNTQDFENKIKQLAAYELAPQEMMEYFCKNRNPSITVNGKTTDFLKFYKKISGKKIKVKKSNLVFEKGSNCIKSFTIEYKKAGLF